MGKKVRQALDKAGIRLTALKDAGPCTEEKAIRLANIIRQEAQSMVIGLSGVLDALPAHPAMNCHCQRSADTQRARALLAELL